MNSRTIRRSLERAVELWPDAPALVFEGRTHTYAELYDAALRRLGGIQAEGIAPDLPVLVMLDNGSDSVITWLALALGGYLEVPVNTAYIGETLFHLVRDSGAAALIAEPKYVARLADMPDDATLQTVLVTGEVVSHGGSLEARRLSDSTGHGTTLDRDELAEAAIMYTSGTTGPSKGAVITERQAFEYAAAVADMLELTTDDAYYAPLPLFHIAGRWAVVYAALQRGARCVLVRRFSINAFWEDVRTNNVTATFLLGAMAQFVLNQPTQPDDAKNSLDRVLMVPLIEGVDEFRARFDTRVTTCFGSTEANVPLVSNWNASIETGAGRPRAGYRIKLVDAGGNEVPDGTPGEMLVKPDQDGMVLRRYHRNPQATASTLRDGWLHTGDVFKRDAQGNFHFVDRLKDSLRKRGENISSFEVEREIRSHPAVVECAVVGVVSEFSEQEIAAFVQLAQGCSVTADEVKAHVARRAPRFLVPDQVHFVAEFPTTPTGKIQKFQLRRQVTT